MMRLTNFHPKKSFGQNFLINPRVVEKIIEAAELRGDETVMEVGPGFGILTKALLERAGHVIAIEKDRDLHQSLQTALAGPSSLAAKMTLILGDALNVPPPQKPYIWVANIPYSITSPLLDHFIREPGSSGAPTPNRAVLMVQKEVAEKICAKPPRMNVLALHVQTFGIPKIIMRVPRANFRPAPKVDSAVIKIDFDTKNPLHTTKNFEIYFSLIHRAFSHKRKMLRATLPQKLLEKADIDPRRRPETLTINEWWKLTQYE